MFRPCLYLIVPCYNEEKVLPITATSFLDEIMLLKENGIISEDSRILFIDDGSKDQTWNIITELSKINKVYCGIRQSRNRGHQNALMAGLMEAKEKCDITISIDCDGQDDICTIHDMVKAYINGNEVVYGVRSNRETDTFFKRFTAEVFYKFLHFMGLDVVFNHADFRLISTKVLKELSNFKEVNLFLRGMIPLVGFQSTVVYYERHERIAGKSHYTLKKMAALAVDGITSLSIKPLQLITVIGIVVSVLSFCGAIWAFSNEMLGATVAGWASTICIVCFMGGVQLICLGVIGEYIGKIYMEVKARPRYIISERVGETVNKENTDGKEVERVD